MPSNPNLEPVRKRKKHAPDRKQPEWLFPAPEENPALKPHKEPSEEAKAEKQRSIEFLKRKAVGATSKAPPVDLLNLVARFLAEYNFISTGRIFAAERQGRSKIDGWTDSTGEKVAKGAPTLGKIYKEWKKEFEMTSDEDDDAATKPEKKANKKAALPAQKQQIKDDDTSSSGSDDSDVEMADAPTVDKAVKTKSNTEDSSDSSSATSSDSDADDEEEVATVKAISSKPIADSLKRKAASSSSSSEGSNSDSSSSEDQAPQAKKTKTQQSESESSSEEESDSSSSEVNVKKTPTSKPSESKSSSDSDSDSSSSEEDNAKPVANSDTSATLSNKKSSQTSESENTTSSSETKDKKVTRILPPKSAINSSPNTTVKSAKKTNTPFSRIPKDIQVDERLRSNAFVPYDYAQKAHEDLIITKGKGFTKEKNKKKRGSYRGGVIDVEGKKGIKFED